MAEMKRSSGARGGRKKSRSKATEPMDEATQEVASTGDESPEDVATEAASTLVPPPPAPRVTPEEEPQLVETRAFADEPEVEAISTEPSGNRNDDNDDDRADETERRETEPARPQRQSNVQAFEAFSTHLYYDKNLKTFIGTVLEFPDIRATGHTREEVLAELDDKIETQLQAMKRRGETPPEAIFSRRYPDKLEVRLSQNLSRKLDIMARQEKVSLEQLVVELLSAGVERRTEAPRGGEQHGHRQKQHHHPHQHQHQHPQQGGQQRHQNQQRGRGRGGYNQESLNNRENFMEYVRSLEKGNWRKK